MGDAVTQFQILSKDPERTAKFYSQLFQWSIAANNSLGYRQIRTGSNDGIQGGIWLAPPQAPNFGQLFVSVQNVKDAIQNAETLGAKVIIPATMLPEGDEMAVLLDPEGMSFAVWRARQN